MTEIKEKALAYYEKNETKVDIAFFLGGYIFDVFTLSEIDDPFSILQQIVYLLITGSILYFEFLAPLGATQVHKRFARAWDYRQLAFHFLLGSLLSIYSLFFLKSASIFSSVIFVILILALMVANEVKAVQKSAVNIKIALYVICLFSFFSMIFPVVLGFVGVFPFLLALLATGLCLWGVYRLLFSKIPNKNLLKQKLVAPSAAVIFLFLSFYAFGWIPPVPLSVQDMGVYHKIEKRNQQYILYHEKPWWKFWQTGDQHFVAQEDDQIYFFARLFSPARFNDAVILHWYFKDPRQGWQTTDRVPMRISGGRKGGYRGYATKQNYTPGEWRISVETTDNREIGRMYFDVIKVDNKFERTFEQDVF